MTVDNKGNLITRRAFADTDRMKVLRRIVNKAMSTAYQMTEEVGEYGSGTPSPLHAHCESIRELWDIELREGCEVSAAREMAEYPAIFLAQLMGGAAPYEDAIDKLNFLMKSASDANYLLRARMLEDLSPGELKEFARLVMNSATLARELWAMIDALLAAAESAYPGAPVQGERARAAR